MLFHVRLLVFRYNEVALSITRKETVVTVQFVVLDMSLLKQAIIDHVHDWIRRFVELLHTIATDNLNDMHSYIVNNSTKYVIAEVAIQWEGESPPQCVDYFVYLTVEKGIELPWT